MKITTNKIDNVTEVLSKVLEFTDIRARILHKNILNVNTAHYRPTDLDAVAFADIMANALSEHIISNRLLLIDSENIKFGPDGDFEAKAVIDQQACQLLASDRKQYLKRQMKKISENQMNQKVAAHLIERKSRKTNLTSN